MDELKTIMKKFASSGWDLIAVPAQQWLDGKGDNDTLVSAIKQPILPIYHVVIQHLLSADYISSACNKRKHYVR